MSESTDVTDDESDSEVAMNETLKKAIARQKQTVDNLKQQLAKEEEILKALQQNVPSMVFWNSGRNHRPQKITRLPDLVLMALFRQLPPADQLTASTVCRRWSDLVPEVTARRRSLAIILDSTTIFQITPEHTFNRLAYGENWQFLKSLPKADGQPMYPGMYSLNKWNSLQLDEPSEELYASIITHFTGIRQLQLFSRQCDWKLYNNRGISLLYSYLAGYLKRLSTQLTALHLAIHHIRPGECGEHKHLKYKRGFVNSNKKRLPDQLVIAINSLSTLKCLAIEVDGPPLPDLAILGRLEEFNCRAPMEEYLNQVQRYGAVDKPTRMRYAGDLHREGTSLSEQLRARFLRIDDIPVLSAVCTHFPSLTSLNLTFITRATKVYDFFRFLSQLKQLEFLHLDQYIVLLEADGNNESPNHHLAPIKSLKILSLTNGIRSHHELDLLNIPRTMPNLEVLQLNVRNLHCTDCGIKLASANTLNTFNVCLRLLFAPLKANCTKLRLLRLSYGDQSGSVDDLLAAPTSSDSQM